MNIAWRNVFRQANRNLLIGISIAISVGLFFAVISIADGVEKQLVANKVQIETGVVSFSPDSKLLENQTQADQKKFEELTVKLSDINGVSILRERVHARAMISNSQRISDVNIRGVDWSREKPLLNSFTFEEAPHTGDLTSPGLIISKSLAKKLKVGLNDQCSILIQTVQGSLNLEDFTIIGIFKNISTWSNSLVFMDLTHAKSLLNTNMPTHVLLDSQNLDSANKIKAEASQILNNLYNTEFDVETYQDRSFVASTLGNANRYGFLSIVIFLQIISFFGIGFVVKNNILERSKEVGTLLALGFNPFGIRFLFVVEMLIVGCLASIIGLLFFGGLLFYYSRHGIFLGDTTSLIFGGSLLRPSPSVMLGFLGLAIGIVYPSLSALLSTQRLHSVNPINLLYDR